MIYLDNAALEQPKKECIDAAVNVMTNHWGNASSTYEFGLESKRIVEDARNKIAKEINCKPEEIIFCGSGSEANSLAIDGWLSHSDQTYAVTSVIEHPSILNNWHVLKGIHCYEDGAFSYNDINNRKNELVSLQLANSEIGTIQEIKSIANTLHENNCILHVDAVQAFGHIPIDVKDLEVDIMTATAQKIGGILGAAFLYVKEGIELDSIIHGNQENGLRGSTYNVPAIASLGTAIDLIDYQKQLQIKEMRDDLFFKIDKMCVDNGVKMSWNGAESRYRLPNNLSLTFKGIDAEYLKTLLDMNGVMVSLGSACCSGEKEPSKVLTAIGLSPEECASTIRITLGDNTTLKECDEFVEILEKCLQMMKTN